MKAQASIRPGPGNVQMWVGLLLSAFCITLLLLMAVSLLSLGIFAQPELAALKNPSMAGVLEKAVGTWGAVLIYVGLIISVGGGFLAWTLLAAESLFTPAGGGVMPTWLARQNDKGVPANALWLTNGMVQLFLLVTLFSKASYLALISLSTAMILVPYLFSAVYGLSLAWRSKGTPSADSGKFGRGDTPVAALAVIYCLWLLYAAGLKYLGSDFIDVETAVVALGGNALLRRGQALSAENQMDNIRRAAAQLARVALLHEVVLTHGNGPQVGLLALQSAAYTAVETYPLDVLGAETEGMIGYLLEQELKNLLPDNRTVTTLLTRVEVDSKDPAFTHPSKPIGPVYTKEEAERIAAAKHWTIAPDGKGFRRVDGNHNNAVYDAVMATFRLRRAVGDL